VIGSRIAARSSSGASRRLVGQRVSARGRWALRLRGVSRDNRRSWLNALGFVRVGLGHHDHAWHANSSAVARTAQPSRLLPGLALGIDTRNTGWPRLSSSAQAAAMRSSRTPGHEAMRPGLSG
jgi:hypothetical protein